MVFVPSTLATQHVVGDDAGWNNNNFDYQAWAQGKEFHYPQGSHNVIKVNGTGFQQCMAPAGAEKFTSGNDVITLSTPGRKWYICGFGNHCESGNQKLAITVMDMWGSPAPSPTSPSSSATKVAYFGWIAAAFGILGLAMIIILMMAIAINSVVFAPQILAEEFVVGDETVFKYTPGVHNVLKVNGTGFQQCTAPAGTEALTTGND
ncbi:hypothetical protein Tsubulata_020495, partial [Turnera subulata]